MTALSLSNEQLGTYVVLIHSHYYSLLKRWLNPAKYQKRKH